MNEMPQPYSDKRYPMPFCRVEIAILSLVGGVLSVLLGKRQQAPYAGRWALPGGVVRIDLDKTLEDSAQRVAKERLGVSLPYLRQQCAVGGVTRDPRAPWALSIVFRAMIPADSLVPEAGKRLDALRWCPVGDAITDSRLAFDHAKLIDQAVATTRSEVERLEFPTGFLPETFTLGELQTICEQILGKTLDKSSFRRRLADRNLVEVVPGEMRSGPFRPAQVYRECLK